MKTETLEQYLYRLYSKQTAKSYLAVINHFTETNLNAKNYNYQEIINYMEGLTKRYSNTCTLNSKLMPVKRYYYYLIAIGERNDHPCKNYKIKGSKKRDIQLQDLFSSDELELLMNRNERYPKLKLRNQIITSFLIYQALTSEEITKIDLKDIDIEQGTVYIKASRKLSARTLDLHRTQTNIIYRYIKEDRKKLLKCKSTKLVINYWGTPESVDGLGSIIERMRGLFPDRKLNTLTIRASVISNWLNEKKYKLEDVQFLAGHKWISTTEKYRRKNPERERKLINEFHPLGVR